MANDETFLLCPEHPDDPAPTRRMVEVEGEYDTMRCPRLDCDYTCRNFLKYPVREVMDIPHGRYQPTKCADRRKHLNGDALVTKLPGGRVCQTSTQTVSPWSTR